MAEELQDLLSRINDDYLKKAELERDNVIATAQAEAAKIVADAENLVAAKLAEAEAKANSYQARAEAAAKQAARDVVLALKAELQSRMANAVGSAAAVALTPEFMAQIIGDLVKAFVKDPDSEVTVLSSVRDAEMLNTALVGSLRGSLKSAPKVLAKSGIRNGLQVSFNGSDLFFDFTDVAVCELLQSYLGSELSKLLDEK